MQDNFKQILGRCLVYLRENKFPAVYSSAMTNFGGEILDNKFILWLSSSHEVEFLNKAPSKKAFEEAIYEASGKNFKFEAEFREEEIVETKEMKLENVFGDKLRLRD
jgi:hypothetical protein